MAYVEFDGSLDGEAPSSKFVPFTGELDKPKGVIGRIKDALTSPSGQIAESGAVDQMTGIDPTGGQAIADPDPEGLGIMADAKVSPNFRKQTSPLRPEVAQAVENQYDAATPEERARMLQAKSAAGDVVRRRDAQFTQMDAHAPLDATDMLDPRAEARARQLAKEGMAPELAGPWGAEGARRGELPGTEVGQISKTDFDFDTQKKYNEDPFFKNPLVRGAVKGYEGFKQGYIGVDQFIADTVGADEAAAGFKKMANESTGFTTAMGEPKNYAQNMFEGAISSIAQQLPALLGGALTGSEPVVLGAMFVQSFGQQYSEGRAAGQDIGDATTRASQMAALEVIGEKFGLGHQMAGIKAAAHGNADAAVRLMAKASLREVPGEEVTTVGQFLVDKEGGNVGLHTEAGVADLITQMRDTVVQTVIQGGLMTGGAKVGAHAVNSTFNTPERQIARAIDNTSLVDNTNEAARAALDPQNRNPNTISPTQTVRPAAPSMAETASAIQSATSVDEAISAAAAAVSAPIAPAVSATLSDQQQSIAELEAQAGLSSASPTAGARPSDAPSSQPSTPGYEPTAMQLAMQQAQRKLLLTPLSQRAANMPASTSETPQEPINASTYRALHDSIPLDPVAPATPLQSGAAPGRQADAQLAQGGTTDTASSGLAAGRDTAAGSTTGEQQPALTNKSEDIAGGKINKEWTAFDQASGTLGINRAEMPQIKAEHRGALVNFLNARGISHEQAEVSPNDLKATQREFSPAKVEKAKGFTGPDRSILVSSDGHVLDGHHQWLAKRESGEPVKVIRLNAPIKQLLTEVAEFPSAEVANGAPAATKWKMPPAAEKAEKPKQEPVLSIGLMPNAAEPITVKNGVVHIGEYPAQNFDTGKDVTVPHGASPAQIRDALVQAGAVGRRQRIFGVGQESAAEKTPQTPSAPVSGIQGEVARIKEQVAKPVAQTREQRHAETIKEYEGLTSKKLRAIANSKTQPAFRRNAANDILQTRDQVNRLNRSNAMKKVYAKIKGIDPDRDTMAQAVAKLGGINRDSAAGRLRLAPEELNRRGHGVLHMFHANGKSMDEIGQQLAELGYVEKDEHGKHDQTDFEDKLAESAGGIDVFTPNAMMIRAADDHAQAMEEVGANSPEVYDEVEQYADTVPDDVQAAIDAAFDSPGEQEALSDEEIDALFGGPAKSGQIPQGDSTGTADASGQGNQAPRETPQGTNQQVAPDDFGLHGQTEAEARAQAATEEQKQDEAAAEERRAAEADRQAGIRKEIDSRQNASADNFQLGQSAEDALAGQRDIFAQPDTPADKPAAEMSVQDHLRAAAQKMDDAANQPQGRMQAAAKAKPETELPEQARIDDFGEKIVGAKKELWATYRHQMAAELPADAQDITLSKHFPEPNYEAMIADGADVRVLAAIKAMRDEIPSKPRMAFKLRRWGDQVKALHAFAGKLLDGSLTIDHVLAEMRHGSLSKFADRIETYAALGYPAFKHANGYEVSDGWQMPGKPGKTQFAIEKSGRHLGMFDTREAAIDALRARLQNEPEGTGRSIKLDLYRVTKTGEIVIGKKVGAGKYIDLKGGFASARDAREYLAANEADLLKLLEQKKEVRPERRSTNDPRIGKDYRQGENVTPEKFAATFGFRGVQFGNYVEQAKRAHDLNNAYDALLDLANTISVPERAISLNGTLGLAFGARGRGGKGAAAAHYEAENVVVNLTKNNGAGSLAHEWWHALDNYFGGQRGKPGEFVTDAPTVRKVRGPGNSLIDDASIRPDVLKAYEGVVKSILASDMVKRSRELDGRRTSEYWSTVTEMTARAFESYIIDKAHERGESNDYLANIVSEDAHKIMDEALGTNEPFPYPTKAEAQTINAAFDKLFKTLQTKETDKGTALFYRPGTNPVDFAVKSGIIPKVTFGGTAPFRTKSESSMHRLRNKMDNAESVATEGGWSIAPKAGPLTDVQKQEAKSDVDALNKALEAAGVQPVVPLLNVPSANHELARRLGKIFGTRVQFVSNNDVFDGVALNGVAYLTKDLKRPELAIAGHEVFHTLEQTNPQLAEDLLDHVRDYLQAGVIEARQQRESAQSGEAISERYAAGEVMADINGAMWLDPQFWREMAARDTSLFRRVAYLFMEKASQAIEALTGTRFDVKSLVTDVDAVRKLIAQTWADHNQGRDASATDESGLTFSRAERTEAENALKALSETDPLFKLPKSREKEVEDIAHANIPGVQVRKLTNIPGETRFNFTFSDGKTARLMVRYHNPYGNTIYGYDMVDGEMTAQVDERPGRNADYLDGKDDVFIDVSLLKEGSGFGGRLYNIAATYAYNNGKVFIGDPAGLSDEALRRRSEQMLSSALKFGTTKHLAPHPRQVKGDKDLGVPPLDWVYGDHIGNIEKLIDVNLANIENAGGIGGIAYNIANGTFTDSDGNELTRDDLSGLAQSGLGRQAHAGGTTLARAAVLGALRDAIAADNRNDAGADRAGRVADGRADAQTGSGRQPGPRDAGMPAGEGGTSGNPVSQESNRSVPAAGQNGVGLLERLVLVASQFPASINELFYSRKDDRTSDLFTVPDSQRTGVVERALSNGPDAGPAKTAILRARSVPGEYATVVENRPGKTERVGLTHVTNPAEAAHVTASLTDLAREHLDVLVLGKAGKILALQRMFAGGKTQSSVHPGEMIAFVNSIPGAESYYGSHNHPSGTPDLSAADLRLTSEIRRMSEGIAPKFEGLLALSHDKFTFTDDGSITDSSGPIPVLPKTKTVQYVEQTFVKRDKLGPAITSPAAARGIIDGVAKGRSGIVLTDTQHQPVGFFPIDFAIAEKLKDTPLARDIIAAVAKTNATMAFLATGNYGGNAGIENVGTLLSRADVRVLDAFGNLELKNPSAASLSEKGRTLKRSDDILFSRKEHAIDTPEFKKWFGASKVVDADGKPLVVYHGTGADITSFDNGKAPNGMDKNKQGAFWFSTSPEVASEFAGHQKGETIGGVKLGHSNVVPVYLSLQNPYIDTYGKYAKGGGLKQADIAGLMEDDYDGIIWPQSDHDLPDTTADGPVRGYYRNRFGEAWGESANGYPDQIAVFKPEQVKSATGNNGQFDSANPDIRFSRKDESAPVFYSALQRAMPQMAKIADKNGMVGAEQARLWLMARQKEGKFKADELAWSGLDEYLKMRVGKVAVADIEAFVRDNGVQVREVTKTDNGAFGSTYVEELRNGMFGVFNSDTEQQIGGDFATEMEAVDAADQHKSTAEVGTKYHKYTLPGGENYRELLLTLPTKGIAEPKGEVVEDGKNREYPFAIMVNGIEENRSSSREYADSILQEEIDRARSKAEKKAGYNSSHWTEPNILAHIRFNDRTDADGKKVLFIEELQSDWGQQGKKLGFATLSDKDVYAKFVEPNVPEGKNPDNYQGYWEIYKKSDDSHVARVDETGEFTESEAIEKAVKSANSRATPLAPFVTDTKAWLSLGIKRMIRYAAENGYDKVAFVNGKQSAERYDLSKQVSKIVVKPFRAERGEYTLDAYDSDGKRVLAKDAIQLADIDDYIGKEVADRARKQVQDYGNANLSGLDLKVGGDGMKAFYDQIVPQVSNDVLKKLGGGKVGKVDLTQAIGRQLSGNERVKDVLSEPRIGAQPGFDITPAMRESVMQGQPLFSRKDTVEPAWDSPEPSKIDDFIQKMQDKQIDTRRVVQAVRAKIGEINDHWNPYLQEELFHGRSAKQVGDFLGNELRPLLQDMQARGITMPEFEQYLHMRHAEERNNQIAKINLAMPDGGSGVDTADAREYLADLSANKKRAYEALAKRIDAINKTTRQILIDSGLEKKGTIKAWEATYQYYVPLQRDEGSPGIGQGFSVKGSASKRAMGSKRPVVNILANLAMQRERTIVRAEKNRVSTALYGLAITAPNPDFWLPVNPDKIDANKQAELIKLGLNPLDVKNLIDEPKQQYIDPNTGMVAERVNPFLRSAPNVISTRVNGEDRYVFFSEHDDRAVRMVRALKNLDADQLGVVLSTMAKVTRYFASVNTQYNPIFGIINLLRDAQEGLLNLSTTPIAGKQKEVLAYTVSALRGIYIDLRDHRAGKPTNSAWAAEFEEFQKEGGQTGYRNMFSNSQERADALTKELKAISEGRLKAAGRAVFDWLSDYNETMENAVRLAAYKVAKEQGLSKQQAASVAKNLTVNFNRKGQIATQAGAMYAFFNATVQGTARMAETLRGPAGKKIIVGGLLLGSMQALLLAAAGFDDDDPPEFVKARNLVIPIGDGKYLTWPMPLGLKAIPNVSRLMTEFVLGGFKNPSKKLVSLFEVFADIFNPLGNAGFSMQTVMPTIADPFIALKENQDWTGKKIAREDRSTLAPTPGYTRAKDTASEISKALSYWVNIASGGTKYKPGMASPTPDQIDYLIGQATGGVGREALKLEQAVTSTITGEDLPPYKIPLAGRFYGDTKGNSSVSAKFYDNIKALNEHEAELKGRRKDHGDVGGYLRDHPDAILFTAANHIERDIASLNKRKRELLEKDASKEHIKLVEQQITARMKRLNDQVARSQAGR